MSFIREMKTYTWDLTDNTDQSSNHPIVLVSNGGAANPSSGILSVNSATTTCVVDLTDLNWSQSWYVKVVAKDTEDNNGSHTVLFTLGTSFTGHDTGSLTITRPPLQDYATFTPDPITMNYNHITTKKTVNDNNYHTYELTYEPRSVTNRLQLFIDGTRVSSVPKESEFPSGMGRFLFLGTTGGQNCKYKPGDTWQNLDVSSVDYDEIQVKTNWDGVLANTVSYGAHRYWKVRMRPKDLPTADDNWLAVSEVGLDDVISATGDDGVTIHPVTLTSTEHRANTPPSFSQDGGGQYHAYNKTYGNSTNGDWLSIDAPGRDDTSYTHWVDVVFDWGSGVERECKQLRVSSGDYPVDHSTGPGKGLPELVEIYHSDDKGVWHLVDRFSTDHANKWDDGASGIKDHYVNVWQQGTDGKWAWSHGFDNAPKSMVLNGTDQRGYNPSALTTAIANGDVTMAAWVKSDVTGLVYFPFTMGEDVSQKSRRIELQGVNFRATNNDTVIIGTTTVTASPPTWYFVAAVFDVTGSAMKLYVDGQEDGSATSVTYQTVSGTHAFVGCRHQGSGLDNTSVTDFFDGKVDEVAAWNKVLTQAELNEIYQAGPSFDLSTNSGSYASSANLKAWWRFDLSDGADSSGNSYALTLHNTPTFDPDVATGGGGGGGGGGGFSNAKSISLNGSSQYGRSAAFMNSYDITISCWVKADALPNTWNFPLCTYYNEGGDAINASGDVRGILIEDNGTMFAFGGGHNVSSATTLSLNTWTHIVCTWKANKDVSIYIDGTHKATENKTGLTTLLGTKLNVGMLNFVSGFDRFWDGFMDEVSVFDVALTAAEVTEAYNSGSPGDLSTHSKSANLQAWWRFEVDDGTDSSGNGRNLTLTGTPTFSTDVP